MNIHQRFNIAYPLRVKWSENYTILYPIKNLVYEFLYYDYSENYIQKMYDDLIEHNILSSDLEKELCNPEEEKREIAELIFNGLYNPFYKQIQKLMCKKIMVS